VIVARFVWMFPATYVPRWLSPALARRDPSPPWQTPFALAFTGIRGIVSLAAALAIPLTIESGEAFPERDLILFLTFAVILVTLVGQGLLLPAVMRALGLANAGRREHHTARLEELAARRLAIQAAMERLDELSAARALSDDIVQPIRARLHDRLNHLGRRSADDDSQKQLITAHDDTERDLITAERDLINDLYRRGKLKDEARRRIERDLDLRDAHMINLLAEE
jgi:monovalent cation/hydrogen antiporter